MIFLLLDGYHLAKNMNCFRRRWMKFPTTFWVLCLVLNASYCFYRYKISRNWSNHYEMDQFEGFNNETGVDFYIVPNIIHYVRFNKTQISFVSYICILSALKNHDPDYIYFHTDVDQFTGKYWDLIQANSKLKSKLVIKYLQAPEEIFGQPLNKKWRFHHGSDIGRIRVIMEYGGIYLDNDVYVVHSLDAFRKFEIAMPWDDGQSLGSQIIIANKNARFLKEWLDCYREYHSDKWYYNAGERPTIEVLYKRPELLHRVKQKFGVDIGFSTSHYKTKNDKWKQCFTVHLLTGHRSYLDPHFKNFTEFNETMIKIYPYAFGEMARSILFS